MQAGISKITETQHIVEDLKHNAHEQEILLKEKHAKSKTVLDQISMTMTNASMKKSEMEELRSKTEEKNVMLQIRFLHFLNILLFIWVIFTLYVLNI